jgi:hypothetical protein
MRTLVRDGRPTIDDPFGTVRYHVQGVLDVGKALRKTLAQLQRNARSGRWKPKDLVTLHVELFEHLVYHIEGTRKPLDGLIRAAYRGRVMPLSTSATSRRRRTSTGRTRSRVSVSR